MKISSKFSLALLAGTILSTPATAAEEKEITVDYLNSLTGPKVTWSETEGNYQTELNGKVWYYDYHKPEGYTDAAGYIYNTLSSANVTNVVFSSLSRAIYNTKNNNDINITGDFIGNNPYNHGGAIDNDGGTIGDISGDFIGNRTGTYDTYYGGAILNGGTIGNITGNFIDNYASGTGGAISNSNTIGDITGNFIGNNAGRRNGGAISNSNTIGNITGNFIDNYASGNGGAISNSNTIGDITGDFIGNYVQSESGYSVDNASGGAIYNSGTIGDITGDFLNNYAKRTSTTGLALGGAVYTTKDMTFTAGGEEHYMSGNYTEDSTRGKNYNAIFVRGATSAGSAPTVTFDTTGGGLWIINDSIEGGYASGTSVTYANRYYNLAFRGDDMLNDDGRTTQYIAINNDIINAGKVTVENTTLKFGSYNHANDSVSTALTTQQNEKDLALNADGHGRFVATLNADGTADLDAAAVTSLSLTNAAFDLYNNHPDEVNLAGWSASNSYLHVDVDIENLTADMLNINGNVEGQTKLVLYPTSAKDITGKSIVFAQSSNDTTGTADSFTVYRVYRSPYMFKVGMTGEGTTEHEWYLTMTGEKNEFAGVEPGEQPDPEVPDVDIPDIDIPDITVPTAPVYGEVVAYGALPAAALEQTRNMVDNVGGQVAATRTQDAAANYNLWVNPTYYTSNIDSPFAIDADIWGIEAGGDIQRDIHNRLGIFVSYRQGEYDMDGNGDKYRSPVGSEIDIDSYIAGLYYRYDHNNWYAFATLYGGIQEADIKTDDGMKSDTDGVEFGASIEGGYDYALTDSVTLTPELGVFYTQVNYDDAEDNVGKSASYDDARQIELEAGVKLAKTFMTDESFANVYVKPSVVQTIVDGDEVNITGLGDVEALDDATLGRIEIGGRYGFTTNLSAYGWANYTFGSDYDATTFGLGLNYTF